MSRSTSVRTALASALTLALAAGAMAQTPVYFSASLDNSQEVPPTTGSGRGFGVIRLDTTSLLVNVFVYAENLSGPAILAHLHTGAVGVSGGIIIGLTQTGSGWTGSGVVSAFVANTIQTGGTYVNVHTGLNPGGEIRGQVVPCTINKYVAALNGANEVPPNASQATGNLVGFMHKPDNRLVYMVSSTGLTGVTSAALHLGATGNSGAAIATLNGSAGTYAGATDKLTTAQMTAIESSGVYAEIQTSAFPSGEIRGQLLRITSPIYLGAMTGAQETPPVATPGFGEASLVFTDSITVSLQADFSGLTSAATAAHLHDGPIGVAGPVVIPMFQASATRWTGSGVLSATSLADLAAGHMYINVHTVNNPGGEIRAQLAPATVPATIGNGCLTSVGTRPEISAESQICIGSTMNVVDYGGLPTAATILGFGFTRDTGGPTAIPLPLQLPAAGIAAPGCFVLSDPAVTAFVFSDGFGTSTLPLAVPLATLFRGLNCYAQWYVFDAAANTAGLVTSNSVTLPIQ